MEGYIEIEVCIKHTRSLRRDDTKIFERRANYRDREIRSVSMAHVRLNRYSLQLIFRPFPVPCTKEEVSEEVNDRMQIFVHMLMINCDEHLNTTSSGQNASNSSY